MLIMYDYAHIFFGVGIYKGTAGVTYLCSRLVGGWSHGMERDLHLQIWLLMLGASWDCQSQPLYSVSSCGLGFLTV